jgi:hypothetical protein
MNDIPERARKLTRSQGAAWLTELGYPTTLTLLDRVASNRTGPKYTTFGRHTLYTREELLAWARHRERHNNRPSYAASEEKCVEASIATLRDDYLNHPVEVTAAAHTSCNPSEDV